uniref:Transmembrane protein (PGPGW) n=1 Tax=Candidatus Kentrum sp. DK TaxID=2126562 RepID=A0A450SU26_9GAMM|nr:MAG: Putative transmembrane protein (PGPGW) [Candidatus Kentron sp. DK]
MPLLPDSVWGIPLPVLLGWTGGISVVVFLVSLIAAPLIIARMPADYFRRPENGPRPRRPDSAWRVLLRLLKNLLAAVLVIGGILMLVLPGQGLLTILIGIGISDFPGKYRLTRRLAGMRGVSAAIGWIRRKAGVAPLQLP